MNDTTFTMFFVVSENDFGFISMILAQILTKLSKIILIVSDFNVITLMGSIMNDSSSFMYFRVNGNMILVLF